ncbi:MAG: Holliday junction resolvase Hjc [Archaeoglobaceae archaeon]|nr:Holliday junction resolvase Hjc [Archaeoglobaceae archaeon]MCX8152355.1 Holliday junction resolvase Hjc [Archaeoglobaceae archaeon]MDW8014186.1 Holliday junction resolvase Hjc [Archaeoglobaceae archaeon]
MKRKGTNFERELVEMLWSKGYAAVRIAGSGAKKIAPDVIAGNGKKFFVFEVKMRKSLPIYLKGDEIEDLVNFSKIFGAEPIIAIKIAHLGWKFFPAEVVGKRIGFEEFCRGSELSEILKNK